MVSSPGLDGDTYGRDDEIRIEVTFDQDVQVTGNPRFQFDLGGSNRQAAYASGGGNDAALFGYVRAGRATGTTTASRSAPTRCG